MLSASKYENTFLKTYFRNVTKSLNSTYLTIYKTNNIYIKIQINFLKSLEVLQYTNHLILVKKHSNKIERMNWN